MARARQERLMHYADHPRDSADFDRATEPRTSHRVDDDVVVERTPLVADAAPGESDAPPWIGKYEMRRGERRRIDRMSTGI
jgi:hypothetical protein